MAFRDWFEGEEGEEEGRITQKRAAEAAIKTAVKSATAWLAYKLSSNIAVRVPRLPNSNTPIENQPSTLGKRPLQGTRSDGAMKRIGTYVLERDGLFREPI